MNPPEPFPLALDPEYHVEDDGRVIFAQKCSISHLLAVFVHISDTFRHTPGISRLESAIKRPPSSPITIKYYFTASTAHRTTCLIRNAPDFRVDDPGHLSAAARQTGRGRDFTGR